MSIKDFQEMGTEELKKMKNQIEKVLSDRRKNEIEPAKLDAFTFYSKIKERLSIELKIGLTEEDRNGLSLNYLKKSDRELFKKINEATTFLNKYLYNLIEKTPSSEDKVKWYVLYTEICTQYLQKIQVILTVSTLINLYQMFPSLLDMAFPGYSKSGIISFILTENINDGT